MQKMHEGFEWKCERGFYMAVAYFHVESSKLLLFF